jgi:hypothetical protein
MGNQDDDMGQDKPQTNVDNILNKIKNHRIVSVAIVVGVIIISIATFIKSIEDISGVLTRSAPTARIYNFSACTKPCNGTNSTHTFPAQTKTIYFQWYFENIPVNSEYTRIWSMKGSEWVRYECSWPGPQTGLEDKVKLANPSGLQSGVWELTILIDKQVMLNETITVEGTWVDWYPQGVIPNCYGLK